MESLPSHSHKTYSTRSLDSVSTIIIHHTVTPNDFLTENIAHYHIQTNDWPKIAYHYVVDYLGKIELTNYHETMSYHASAANGYSVGVALKGRFTYEPPADIQIEATRWLVARLRGEMPITNVIGHCDADGAQTECPGTTWPEWRDRII